MEIIFTHFRGFFLVFSRVAGIFIATPVFASQSIPALFKGGLAVLVAAIIYPVVNGHLPPLDGSFPVLIVAAAQETLIGLLIGLVVAFLIQIYQLSAEYYSVQLGFGIISVFDPTSENNIPLIGQFQSLFGLIIFLMLDGDAMVLTAVRDSFALWQGVSVYQSEPLYKLFFDLIQMVFVVSFHIGAPLMAIMFLLTLASGLMSRAAPQMNIMIMELPVKIAIGLLSLMFLMPVFFNAGYTIMNHVNEYLNKLIRLAPGPAGIGT